MCLVMETVDKITAGICAAGHLVTYSMRDVGNIAMTAQPARDKYIHPGLEQLFYQASTPVIRLGALFYVRLQSGAQSRSSDATLAQPYVWSHVAWILELT